MTVNDFQMPVLNVTEVDKPAISLSFERLAQSMASYSGGVCFFDIKMKRNKVKGGTWCQATRRLRLFIYLLFFYLPRLLFWLTFVVFIDDGVRLLISPFLRGVSCSIESTCDIMVYIDCCPSSLSYCSPLQQRLLCLVRAKRRWQRLTPSSCVAPCFSERDIGFDRGNLHFFVPHLGDGSG